MIHRTHTARRYVRIFTSFLPVLLLCFSLPVSLFAAATTPEQAEAVVKGWLRLDATPLGTALGRQIKEVKTYKDEAGSAAYYIVNLNPSGFVVVSADDLIEPIIAFAEVGAYDPAVTNPLGALVSQDQRARMAAAKAVAAPVGGAAGRAVASGGSQQKWAALIASAASEVAARGISPVSDLRVDALVKSQWDQHTIATGEHCYDLYTGGRPCGCVATAMAQLMRFHEHPSAGLPATPFWIVVDGSVRPNFLLKGGDGNRGPYVWSDMPFIPDGNTTQAQREAIGRLCYDAGVATHMKYAKSVSTTNLNLAKAALYDTFQYDNAVCSAGEIGSVLPQMINPNLDAGFPVLLGIRVQGTQIGHAIVCDGYGNDSGAMCWHLNLGWSGNSDAWYKLPTVDYSETQPAFNVLDTCVYNVFPAGSGEIISGRIVDTAGNPIAGATVSASGTTITATSSDGTNKVATGIFALVGVSPSITYSVTASKQGYSFTSKPVSVGRSEDGRPDTGNRWGVNLVGSDAPPPAPIITNVAPSSGPLTGGTSVTITGSNFTGANAVTFGSVDATTFTVNSATQITATTPPQGAPGAVAVSVTVAGATGTLDNAFTYTVSASQPTIADISPASSPLAGGTTVTVTGTNFATTGTVTVLFGSTAATGVTVASATQITCTTPACAAGIVDVKVTNPDGQSVTKPMAFTYRDAVALTKDVAVNGDTSSGGLFYYYFDVPAGVTQVRITTIASSTEDILDLGVNNPATGSYPDEIFYADVCSLGYSGNETVIFNTSPVQPGRYYILLARPEYGSGGAFSITATYVTGGAISAPSIDTVYSDNGVFYGGSYVSIYGSNFATTGTVTVAFGDTAATDVYVDGSASVIYCRTPACPWDGSLAKSVDVAVTNPDGQSATLAQGFRYVVAYIIHNGISYPFTTARGDVPLCFDAPAGVRSVTIATSNTVGDVLDLAVNTPATGVWPGDPYSGDVSPGTDSGDETAKFTGTGAKPGRYYILVGQYGDGGPFTITATAEMPQTFATKRKFMLNFSKTSRDNLDITFSDSALYELDKVAFSLPADAYVFIGSNLLDKATLTKGRGTGSEQWGKFQWNGRKGQLKYSVRNASLQDILKPYGAHNKTTTFAESVNLPVLLWFNGAYYGDYYSFSYTAKEGKTGKGK